MPDQLAIAGVADLEMYSSLNLRASDQILSLARNAKNAADIRRVIGIDVVVTFGTPCPGRQIGSVPATKAFICRSDDALGPPYWIPASAVTALNETASPKVANLDLSTVLASARSLTIVSWSPDGDELVIDAPADGYVWIDRSWCAQWTTSVDGRGVNAYSAMAGQLVPVPAGRHTLVQRLVPWDAGLGLLAGLLALALALAWLHLVGRPTGDRARLASILEQAHFKRLLARTGADNEAIGRPRGSPISPSVRRRS
jgi:hypothetical protein